MYNAELKERFMSDFTESQSRYNAIRTMFEFLEKYEEEQGADVCTFDVDTLRPILSELLGVQSKSFGLRMTSLRKYSTWCVDNNIPNAKLSIYEFSNNEIGLEKLKRQMVANPLHLQRYLDALFEPVEDQTRHSVYRCYYWLAFMGINERDAMELTADNVDFENMRIVSRGYEYPIYLEALPSIRASVRMKVFNVKYPGYADRHRDRFDGDKILRGFTDISISTMRSSIATQKATAKQNNQAYIELGMDLTYQHTQVSGIYYRMSIAEKAGMPVDFTPIVEEFMSDKEYSDWSHGNTPKRSLLRQYETDYARWKSAFNI